MPAPKAAPGFRWAVAPSFGIVGKCVLFGALGLAAVVLVLAAVRTIVGGYGPTDQLFVYHTVVPSDLPITVTERGNLESQKEIEIVCELENIGYDRSGGSGTQILYIVPNGKSVNKGELLVELDSAPLQDRLDNQVLATERARAEHIQAKAKFENQKTQNETTLAEAKLQVELAELELKMFEDGEDGTYQLQLQTIDLSIQEAKNKIVEAEAGLLMQTTDVKGVEMLYKLGYKSKGDLDQAQVNYLKSQGVLVRATNELANAKSNRKKIEQYDYPMQKLELEGKLETTKRAVLQVERDNESMLAQAEAAFNGAQRALEKEEEKLEKYQAQLGKCKICAPQDGMVAYATERSRSHRSATTISEGAFVRERQRILTLPSLTEMQVKTAVHESVLDQVRKGLPTTVRIDAFPDRTYKGTVRLLAVMPDDGGWLSSGTKVYETIVTIDEKVERLKPGMTAIVEIHVDCLKNVLSVPVQAVVQRQADNWCYVDAGRGVERRMVTLGRTNDKFVEICAGLSEGDRVVLNPMAIVEEEQEADAKLDTADEDSADEAAVPPEPESTASQATDVPEQQGGGPADATGQPDPRDESGGSGRPRRASQQEPPEDESPRGRRPRQDGPNLMQYDTNGDGRIGRDEAPERIQSLFGRIDSNGDGYVTADEISATVGRARGNRAAGSRAD
ncbi:MAG: hypothetical protein A2W31_13130 [Planctomycetes bacterium RBG_16_64_10]|nr:MAG: hypothetical protein A2W31_13130 [Planctomycetes bacterium RBG_16_64_10]